MCYGTLLFYLQFSNDVWKWWAFFFICTFTICVSSWWWACPSVLPIFLIKSFVFLFLSYSLLCETLFSLLLRYHVLQFPSDLLVYLLSLLYHISLSLLSFKSFLLYTSFLSHLTYCHDFRNCCVQSPVNPQLTLWARPLFQDEGIYISNQLLLISFTFIPWIHISGNIFKTEFSSPSTSDLLYFVFPILVSDISIQLRQKLALMSLLPLSPLP